MGIVESIPFDNNGSQGLLEIINLSGPTVLHDEEPVLVTWRHNNAPEGISGALMAWEGLHQKIISPALSALLNQGKIDLNDPDLISIFKFLVSGEYAVRKVHLADLTDLAPALIDRFKEISLEFLNDIHKENEATERDKYLAYFEGKLQKKDRSIRDIVEQTTSGFHAFADTHFIMTKPRHQIDPEVVERYMEAIKQGARPYCLVLSNFLELEEPWFQYVLDGHHKLEAYINLHIKPNFIEIRYMVPSDFDWPNPIIDFTPYLYSWQVESFFEDCYTDPKSISALQQMPDHPYYRLIKEGEVETFWINGRLKSRGTYSNHQPHGVMTAYDENGRIQRVFYV